MFEEVRTIISEKFDLPVEDIQLDSRFKQDLDIDSLDLVDLEMTIENQYQILIGAEVAEKIKTVNDLVLIVEKSTNVQR